MEECVNKKRVARLMRFAKSQGVSRRRSYIVATRRGNTKQLAPDSLHCQFVDNKLNKIWASDMT